MSEESRRRPGARCGPFRCARADPGLLARPPGGPGQSRPDLRATFRRSSSAPVARTAAPPRALMVGIWSPLLTSFRSAL